MTEKILLPIGDIIKEIRKDKQMTLKILSEESGVSKAMLSQIESAKVNPTISTVWKISIGLKVDINELTKVVSVKTRNFTLTKSSDIVIADPLEGEEGVHIKDLTSIDDTIEDIEIYLMTFEKGRKLNSEPHFKGAKEYLTLLEGTITVTAGKNVIQMNKGDFLSYHSDIEHSLENSGENEAILHLVLQYHKKQ
ncbi:MAG: helix-turn-helix transcriptional regulator [Spirochaetales bacterium]|nr:helix-turn-helix transcriptional regulator [Spirochaetales bacterium]